MELNIHPFLPEETPYFYKQCKELDEKTGNVGCFIGRFEEPSSKLVSDWTDHTSRLNTAEFADDFNNMVDTLRQDMLKSRKDLRMYCMDHPGCIMLDSAGTDPDYGFRINTGKYSYMLRCNFSSPYYAFVLTAYSFLALDRNMREARNGVPILDLQGYERFRIPDGGKLKIASPDGFAGFCTVRYLDQNRLALFDEFHKSTILPIRELPKWAAINKYQLVPVNQSIRDSCRPRRKGQER